MEPPPLLGFQKSVSTKFFGSFSCATPEVFGFLPACLKVLLCSTFSLKQALLNNRLFPFLATFGAHFFSPRTFFFSAAGIYLLVCVCLCVMVWPYVCVWECVWVRVCECVCVWVCVYLIVCVLYCDSVWVAVSVCAYSFYRKLPKTTLFISYSFRLLITSSGQMWNFRISSWDMEPTSWKVRNSAVNSTYSKQVKKAPRWRQSSSLRKHNLSSPPWWAHYGTVTFKPLIL